MSIAETILEQLGGRRFTVMTGASNYVGLADGLQMNLPSRMTKNKTPILTIRLRDDLYDIETIKINRRSLTTTVVEKSEGIGVEQLRQTFESMTGLYTRF